MNQHDTQQHESGPDIDWAALFFDPGNDLPGKLMARARKRFGTSPDAEAAYNHALDLLAANDFAVVRERYAGKGSAAGFLSISFLNAMEEYARHKYPRARPPAWLKRLGELWINTWRMLCLQRQSVESIVDALGTNESVLRDEIRAATLEIKRRVPNCGQVIAEQTALDDAPLEPASTGEGLDQESEQETSEVLLQVLGGLLGKDISPEQLSALGALGDAIAMSDTERLLMRLIYEQDHKIASAARALELPRKQASRMHAAVLQRLRAALVPLGLTE